MDDVLGQKEDVFFVLLLLTVYRTHADSFHRRALVSQAYSPGLFLQHVFVVDVGLVENWTERKFFIP